MHRDFLALAAILTRLMWLVGPMLAFGLLSACLPFWDEGAKAPPLTVQPDEPLLRVSAPSVGAEGVMKLVGRNGAVDTWMSFDLYSVSLQKGVVVATRGFGFDMMAGDGSASLEAMALLDGREYGRQIRYLTSDNHSSWLMAACHMGASGRDRALRRYDEKCRARRHVFTNHYWMDAKGQIVQSRQWVSPELGYLEIAFDD